MAGDFWLVKCERVMGQIRTFRLATLAVKLGQASLRSDNFLNQPNHDRITSMLVTFLGSPQSGKTTTAAMTFASLKQNHVVAEFVLEQARFKIAVKRFTTGSSQLTPEDQMSIFANQILHETVMATGSSSVVISDSSPINNLIYLEDWKSDTQRLKGIEVYLKTMKPLIFLCHPIDDPSKLVDANRIHSLEESLVLHQKFKEILEHLKIQPVPVHGDPGQRLATVLQEVYDCL